MSSPLAVALQRSGFVGVDYAVPVLVAPEPDGGAVLEAIGKGDDLLAPPILVRAEFDQEGHVVGADLRLGRSSCGEELPSVVAALSAVGKARILAEHDSYGTCGQAVFGGFVSSGAHVTDEHGYLVGLSIRVFLNDDPIGRRGLGTAVFGPHAGDGNGVGVDGTGHAHVIFDHEGNELVDVQVRRVHELESNLGGLAGVDGASTHRVVARHGGGRAAIAADHNHGGNRCGRVKAAVHHPGVRAGGRVSLRQEITMVSVARRWRTAHGWVDVIRTIPGCRRCGVSIDGGTPSTTASSQGFPAGLC